MESVIAQPPVLDLVAAPRCRLRQRRSPGARRARLVCARPGRRWVRSAQRDAGLSGRRYARPRRDARSAARQLRHRRGTPVGVSAARPSSDRRPGGRHRGSRRARSARYARNPAVPRRSWPLTFHGLESLGELALAHEQPPRRRRLRPSPARRDARRAAAGNDSPHRRAAGLVLAVSWRRVHLHLDLGTKRRDHPAASSSLSSCA